MEKLINSVLLSMNSIARVYMSFVTTENEIKSKYEDRYLNSIEYDTQLANAETTFKSKMNIGLNDLERSLETLKLNVIEKNDFIPTEAEGISAVATMLSKPGLNLEIVGNVIQKYVGNQSAINLISNTACEEYKGVINYYKFNSAEAIENILQMVYRIKNSNRACLSIMPDIRTALIEFSKHQGITLSTNDLEAIEDLRTLSICSFMGITPESFGEKYSI